MARAGEAVLRHLGEHGPTGSAALRTALTAREKHEAEQAELARLREEAARREQEERERRIAEEAAAKARAGAEAKAKAEREAAEAKARAEQEAAERARIAAEQAEARAKAEAEAAKLREQDAERRRIEAEAKAELAKAREQKPVAWCDGDGDFYCGEHYPNAWPTAVPLYAAPVHAAPAVSDDNWRRFSDDDLAEIHQLAYALGGTDSGEYLLDGDQLDQIVVKCASLFYAFPVKAAPAVPDKLLKCWLIERPASSEWPAIWLTITTDGRRWVSDGGTMYATGGDWYFTSAASEALKFADKESAGEYVRHNKIRDVVVTEHIFDNRALLQSAEGEPKC